MTSNNGRSAIQVFSHTLRRPVGIKHAENNEHKSAYQYTKLKPKSYKQEMAFFIKTYVRYMSNPLSGPSKPGSDPSENFSGPPARADRLIMFTRAWYWRETYVHGC